MNAPIELDQNTKDVLRGIYQMGTVRGAELMQQSNVDPEKLKTALTTLVKESLVAVTASDSSPLRSFFSIQPSVAGIVRDILSR
jgi:DNA-binding HxlR family transcriptional regulator